MKASSGSQFTPEREDYRLLIKHAWEDLHDSRSQDWKALVAITGAHLVILQVVAFLHDAHPDYRHFGAWAGAGIGLLFVLVGVLISFRHRRLLVIKTSRIYRAEEKLGLVENRRYDDDTKADTGDPGIIPIDDQLGRHLAWGGLKRPRLLSTGGLITLLYVLLGLLDVGVAVLGQFLPAGVTP